MSDMNDFLEKHGITQEQLESIAGGLSEEDFGGGSICDAKVVLRYYATCPICNATMGFSNLIQVEDHLESHEEVNFGNFGTLFNEMMLSRKDA